MSTSYPYVDCHTHLDAIYEKLGHPLDSVPFSEFSAEWPAGFDGCLTTFSETFDGVLHFLDEDARVYGAVGLHPHGASRYDAAFEAALLQALSHPKIRALGEIGLDYHYTLSPVDVQQRVFEREIGLAVERQLPITIHTREAEADTLAILKRAMPRDHFFHVHCFTDSWAFAEQVLKEWPNAYFGFTGVLTFKNSKKVQSVCRRVPMDRLLSETDGPYMAPVPQRGEAAHPGHIPHIIAKIAELHGIAEEDAAQQLRENCRKIYKF